MRDVRIARAHFAELVARSRAFGLFVVVGTALVVLSVGLVGQAAQDTHRGVERSAALRALEVYAQGQGDEQPLTAARIAELAALPGAEAVRPLVSTGGMFTEAPMELPDAFAATPFIEVGQSPVVESVRTELGRLADDEVVLPRRMGSRDLTPLLGEKVVFEYSALGEEKDGEAVGGELVHTDLRVVGLYDEAMGDRQAPGSVYVSEATAVAMAADVAGVDVAAFRDRVGFPSVVVQAGSADAVEPLQRRISGLGYHVTSIHSQLTALPAAMRMVELMGRALAVVLLAVCLLAGLSIGAGLVRARLREIGVLKAVGFGNARVAGLLGGELALLGALAGALGVLLGAVGLLATQAAVGGGELLGVPMADGFALPGAGVLLGLVCAPALALVLGAGLPLYRAARVSPDVAMRDPHST